MHDVITALERSIWDALCSGDAAADAALLHPDFIGVYPDGFAGRAAHAGSEEMYVSSVWRDGDEGWRNIFSQDTPAQDRPTTEETELIRPNHIFSRTII